MDRLPDFVIIGAMKCATSTLHDQLAHQPGFFMSTPKEPNFFSDDDVYAHGLDWYKNLFAAAAATDLCGESSTHYTKRPRLPHTLDRMLPVLPHARLIYVMRHPINRLRSHYVHEWGSRRVSGPIDQEIDINPDLINFSLYSMQLEPYLEAYGQENILPLFFERIVRDPQDTLEHICRFLGYHGTPQWHAEYNRRNVGAERMRSSKVRDLLVNAPGLRTIRRKLVPKAWREWVKGFWRIKSTPQLSDATVSRLRDIFDPDLEKVGKLIGTKLTCDNLKEVGASLKPGWAASGQEQCKSPDMVHS